MVKARNTSRVDCNVGMPALGCFLSHNGCSSSHRRHRMKTTRQEVWRTAKECGVDHFIAAIAKAFPDAIEIVVVESADKVVWCKTKDDDV